jgi:polyferredoxin
MSKNLLKIGIVRLIIKNKYFPVAFRVMNLFSTIFLIYIGWGLMDDRLRYTNLTSFLIWSVWWPMIIIMAIFTGRGWCTLCHQKLISDVLSKYGLNWKVPTYIEKYGTTATIISVFGVLFLHSTVAGYHVDKIAGLSALYLLILLVYVAVISLLFEQGAFCKSFCPLVGFLGIYSRCCPIELGPEDPEKCKTCKDKECKKHCSNGLEILEMDSQMQEGCLLCLECAKRCPNDNVSLSFRSFFKGLWDSPKRTTAEALAVIFLLGIVIAEVGEQYTPFDDAQIYIPGLLAKVFGFETIFDSSTGGVLIWEVLWILVAVPLILIGLSGIVANMLSKSRDFNGIVWNIIKMYSLGFVPLILGLHAVKMLFAFESGIGYLPYTIDNLGSNAILSVPEVKPLIPDLIMGYILMAFFLLFGVFGSLYSIWKIARYFKKSKNDKNAIPFMVTIVAIGFVFVYVIYHWLIIG